MTDRNTRVIGRPRTAHDGFVYHLRGRSVSGRPAAIYQDDFYWKVLMVRDRGAWRVSGWKDISIVSRPIETVGSQSSTTG